MSGKLLKSAVALTAVVMMPLLLACTGVPEKGGTVAKVETAVKAEPGSGQAGSTAKTESPMSRAEFIAMISDFFAWSHPSEYNDIWKTPLRQLNDVKTTDRYGKQIEVAVEEGIISADDSGNFRPAEPVARQDAATVFANAFRLERPDADALAVFTDAASIREDSKAGVNAMVASGFMQGKTPTVFGPEESMTKTEAEAIFNDMKTRLTAPVQALPKTNSVAPRRYVKLYCPTPGAVIYYTSDNSTPTTSSEIYTVAAKGHINEMLSAAQMPGRAVVYKAFAVKEGREPSPIRTFAWRLYRPASAEFQHLLIREKTATGPAVYRICNDSESVRAMAWYIEGQDGGLCFDALQTPHTVQDLKKYIDANIATKPNFVVIGHEHGDHDMQAPAFMKAGFDVYLNERGWAAVGTAGGPFPAVFADPADQAKIKNVEEGDIFHLGGCDLYVYAMPGHANGNIVLQDKANGLIFSSDIYGCTRAGSADNVAVTGVRADLMLSLAQQTYANYRKNGGKIERLFTGHDETPLGDNNLKLFEAAFQQVVDWGEAGCSPTLRGKNDAPNSRTTLIGDMWKDGTNWIAIKLPGVMGDATEYLTSSPINYNGKDGYLKYSVLSNIEIEGGELVGTTLSWAPDPAPFSWAGVTKSVSYSLPNKFNPWVYEYEIKVPKARDSVTIVPVSMSTKVKSITLNGKEAGYGSRNTIRVADGSVVTIGIVAPDGVTSSTYTFTVRKE